MAHHIRSGAAAIASAIIVHRDLHFLLDGLLQE